MSDVIDQLKELMTTPEEDTKWNPLYVHKVSERAIIRIEDLQAVVDAAVFWLDNPNAENCLGKLVDEIMKYKAEQAGGTK